MTEKKYTGFAALYQLDQETDQRSAKISPVVNQSASLVNHGQPELVNRLTSPVNQLTSESLVNQPPAVVNQSASDESNYPSRKERKLLGLRLPKEKLEQYRLWCLINRIDLQDAVEKAMDWLTNQPAVNQLEVVNQSAESHHDHDDHDDNSHDDDITIISLFEQIVETKYKRERDRPALAKIRGHNLEVVEAGFTIARLRAKAKINSMSYCLPVIDEVVKAGISGGAGYLKYLRAKLQEAKGGK